MRRGDRELAGASRVAPRAAPPLTARSRVPRARSIPRRPRSPLACAARSGRPRRAALAARGPAALCARTRSVANLDRGAFPAWLCAARSARTRSTLASWARGALRAAVAVLWSSRAPRTAVVSPCATLAVTAATAALRDERHLDGALGLRGDDAFDRLTAKIERRGLLARDDRQHVDTIEAGLDLGAQHLAELHGFGNDGCEERAPRLACTSSAPRVAPIVELARELDLDASRHGAKLSTSRKKFISARQPG